LANQLIDVRESGFGADVTAVLVKLLAHGFDRADTMYLADKALLSPRELRLLRTTAISVAATDEGPLGHVPLLRMSMEFLDGPNQGQVGFTLNFDLYAPTLH
jgi:hypothetical protein